MWSSSTIYGTVIYFLYVTPPCVYQMEMLSAYMSDSPELFIDFSDGLILFLVSVTSISLALWRLWVYFYVALMQELFTVNIMGHENCTGSMVKL